MDRLFILAIACVTQIGCQSPYSPFGIQSTRVPPPPTGAIGSGNYDAPNLPSNYPNPASGYPPASSPQNYPSSTFPSNSPSNAMPYGGRLAPPASQSPIGRRPPSIGTYIPPVRGPGETITNVGPWRYWESAQGTQQLAAASRRTLGADQSQEQGDNRLSNLTHNDQLKWTEPEADIIATVEPQAIDPQTIEPTVVRGNNLPVLANSTRENFMSRPRYIPVPQGSTQVSQGRVQAIPASVVQPQAEVRQASAVSDWHSAPVGTNR